MLHEEARAERAQLLTAEGDQYDGTRRSGMSRFQETRDFEECRGPGRVGVRAIVHAARGIGIERAKAAHSQVIIVRADEHRLAAESGRAPGNNGDDVARRDPTEIRMQRRRGVSRNGEILKRCRYAGASEGVADVRARALEPRRSDAASFLAIVRKKADVRQHAACRRRTGILLRWCK